DPGSSQPVVLEASAAEHGQQPVLPVARPTGLPVPHGLLLPPADPIPRLPLLPVPANGPSLAPISSLLRSGRFFHLTTHGGRIYAANLWGVVSYLVRPDGAGISLDSQMETPGHARWLAFYEDRIYVAEDYAGITVLNSRTGAVLETMAVSGGVRGLEMVGGYVYACAHSGGLYVFSPRAGGLEQVAKLATPGKAFHLCIAGDRALLSDGPGSMLLLDVADPATPTILAAVSDVGFALASSIRDTIVAVADRGFGVRLYRMTTSGLSQIAAMPVPGETRQVLFRGDLLYVIGSTTLRVFEVDAATGTMKPLQELPAAYEFRTAVIQDRLLVAAESDWGVRVMWIEDDGRLHQTAAALVPRLVSDVAVEADLVCVAAGRDGIHIGGMGADGPSFVSRIDILDKVESLVLSGNTLYAVDHVGLSIFDLSAPKTPRLVSRLRTPGAATGVDVTDTLAVVADWFDGVVFYDVSDSSHPLLLSRVPLDHGWALDAAWAPPHVYACCNNAGLLTIDASDPTAPVVTDINTEVTAPEGIIVHGGYIYVADFNAGLVVFSRADPARPRLMTSYPCGVAKGLTVRDNMLYLANYYYGVKVFDITSPHEPHLAATYDTPGKAYEATVWNNLLLVADWHDLAVLRIEPPHGG
ncbi:hypothetical protein JW905_11940, partial [bacterium]|nr:hypothetical protein [candidate division CSSED10-310 bacterium]